MTIKIDPAYVWYPGYTFVGLLIDNCLTSKWCDCCLIQDKIPVHFFIGGNVTVMLQRAHHVQRVLNLHNCNATNEIMLGYFLY